jgi:type I restriction enzyme S subunit
MSQQSIEDVVNNSLDAAWPCGDLYKSELRSILLAFANSEQSDNNFVDEISNKQSRDAAFHILISRAWEATIWKILQAQDIVWSAVRKTGRCPDFSFILKDKPVYIEATAPKLSDIFMKMSKEYPLNPERSNLSLQAWTGAIVEKAAKYRNDLFQTNAPHPAYVIAVNSCLLQDCEVLGGNGFSNLPRAVEAVFPIGPMTATVDRATGDLIAVGPRYQIAFTKRNKTGASIEIEKSMFMDGNDSHVSAIIGCSDLPCSKNPLSGFTSSSFFCVVHNPYARVPLGADFLPQARHYRAEITEDEIVIRWNDPTQILGS